MNRLNKYYYVIGILILLVLASAGVGYYYFHQNQVSQALLKNPNLATEKQTAALVAQVGQLIVLPTDEQPTIATVTDAAKLKDQAFFSKAMNGDKVLIYVKSKKAILFRPTSNKIIDVAPVNIASSQPTAAPVKTNAVVSPEVANPSQTFVPVATPTAAPTK